MCYGLCICAEEFLWNLKWVVLVTLHACLVRPGVHFSKTLESFQAQKAIVKSWTLRWQSCFIHIIILNISTGSLHTRSFRCIHSSIFRYIWTKTNKFPGLSRNRSWALPDNNHIPHNHLFLMSWILYVII